MHISIVISGSPSSTRTNVTVSVTGFVARDTPDGANVEQPSASAFETHVAEGFSTPAASPDQPETLQNELTVEHERRDSLNESPSFSGQEFISEDHRLRRSSSGQASGCNSVECDMTPNNVGTPEFADIPHFQIESEGITELIALWGRLIEDCKHQSHVHDWVKHIQTDITYWLPPTE